MKTVRKWAYCLKPGEKNPLDQGAPAALKEKPKPVKKIKKSTKKKLPNPFSIPDELVLPMRERVIPRTWMPNNRKAFVNWFDSNYGSYRVKKGN